MTFQEAYERISAMPDDSACKRFIQRRLYVMAESAGEMELDGDYVETVEELIQKQRLWMRGRTGEVVYVMPSHIKDVTPRSYRQSAIVFAIAWLVMTIALVYWGRL